jgi:hypothetical protein
VGDEQLGTADAIGSQHLGGVGAWNAGTLVTAIGLRVSIDGYGTTMHIASDVSLDCSSSSCDPWLDVVI